MLISIPKAAAPIDAQAIAKPKFIRIKVHKTDGTDGSTYDPWFREFVLIEYPTALDATNKTNGEEIGRFARHDETGEPFVGREEGHVTQLPEQARENENEHDGGEDEVLRANGEDVAEEHSSGIGREAARVRGPPRSRVAHARSAARARHGARDRIPR